MNIDIKEEANFAGAAPDSDNGSCGPLRLVPPRVPLSTSCVSVAIVLRYLFRKRHNKPAPTDKLVVGVHECIHGVLLGAAFDERETSGFALVGAGLVKEEI